MDENIFDKDNGSMDDIKPVDLRKTMEKSYIEYAMSVIASRALPVSYTHLTLPTIVGV